MSGSTSFVRLCLGFLLGATGAHASCPIELSAPSVVVKYGDPVQVVCTTSASLFDGMGWEASQGGVSLQEAPNVTWSVPSLTQWTINPKCFFNPLDESTFEQCDKTVKVVLYTFPQNISISLGSGSNGTIKENEGYDLKCDIHHVAPVGKLKVRWYKGDQILNTDSFDNSTTKEPANLTSVLHFNATRQDNGVTFRCEAHLDLGPEGPHLKVSSQEFNITVHFGPDVQCSAIELLESETLEEHCPVTGNPTPSVRWLKNGKPFTGPLSRGDAGLYSIEAKGLSFVQKELRVDVLYGPELTCPSNYTALEDSPHNLTCIIQGYPRPEIVWYKDGEEVELPVKFTRRETGQYLITASNNVSSVNLTVEIAVQYPPSQIVELENSEVEAGSTAWLKCSATGNPRPKYSWDYYRSANVKEEHEDGVSRLLIHNSTALNMGNYTCHAWNDRGNVSKTVNLTVKGAQRECPIDIIPDRMVVQYQGGSQNATCQLKSTGSGNVHWQDVRGVTTTTSWSVDTHKDWDPRPVCTAMVNGRETCQKYLDFTLYKTPDSVSVRPVANLSSAVEETDLKLQCDVTNVAPARNLSVRCYRGNDTTPLFIGGPPTSCRSENHTDCNVRSPVNVSFAIVLQLDRNHNGTEIRCEAQLELGLEGPRPPPIKSNLLNITYYKPIINTRKLAKTIPLFRGYPEELVCEAEGYPTPKIHWDNSPDTGDTLTVTEAGLYNCTATNIVGTVSFQVEVILTEDYLPLIAGFVAVTVVAISIIFLFIYSIYYKNTKMRRYSLKSPRISSHNGNVAHNTWDLPLPMTKLT